MKVHSYSKLQGVPNLSIFFGPELRRKFKKFCVQNDPSTGVDQKRINVCGLISTEGHEASSEGQGERNHLDITVVFLYLMINFCSTQSSQFFTL